MAEIFHSKDGIPELKPDKKRVMIGVKNGSIVLQFAQPLQWVAFKPQEARAVARMLYDSANSAEKAN
jgi:hypothetical protein